MTILLSDGTAKLPSHIFSKHHIKVLPDNMVLGKTLVTPDQFAQYFDNLSQNEEIFFLTSSSLTNTMYFTAQAGAKQCSNVCVIDSKQQSIGYGLQLIQAAQLIDQGYSNAVLKKTMMAIQKHQTTLFYRSSPVRAGRLVLPKSVEIHAMLSGRKELQSSHFLISVGTKRFIHMITKRLELMDASKTFIGFSYQKPTRLLETMKEICLRLGCLNDNIVIVEQQTDSSSLIISLLESMKTEE